MPPDSREKERRATDGGAVVRYFVLSQKISDFVATIYELSENFLEIVFPLEEEYESNTVHDTVQVATQVTMQVENLVKIMNGELSRIEIMKQMKLNNREYFLLEYLQPALQAGFVEMTIPDKPKSKLQKYRLTEKGMELKKQGSK